MEIKFEVNLPKEISDLPERLFAMATELDEFLRDLSASSPAREDARVGQTPTSAPTASPLSGQWHLLHDVLRIVGVPNNTAGAWARSGAVRARKFSGDSSWYVDTPERTRIEVVALTVDHETSRWSTPAGRVVCIGKDLRKR